MLVDSGSGAFADWLSGRVFDVAFADLRSVRGAGASVRSGVPAVSDWLSGRSPAGAVLAAVAGLRLVVVAAMCGAGVPGRTFLRDAAGGS